MALSLIAAAAGFSPHAPGSVIARNAGAVSIKMETVEDLKKLSDDLNPIVGYWNPLGLGDDNHLGLGFAGTLWNEDQEATIGWFRQAEIKHGRIAMFGFVGFMVQSAGICWPWNIEPGRPFAEISAAGGPGDQWDALPANAKWQIILFVGLMELFSEAAPRIDGEAHYMRGGKPGYFPSLKKAAPHPVPLDFYDPFGLFAKKYNTPEAKARGLLVELNNGRLAMIGLFGAISATKGLIVPGMDSLPLAPYAGEYMKPFENGFGF